MFGKPTNIPNPEDYWRFAELTFRIFLSLVVFTCTIKMTSIFFQAVGKPVHAIVSSVTRDIICFVPLVLILPCFFGVEGVLYAAPIADFLAMTVAVFMTVRFMRSLGKETQMKGLSKALLKESKEGDHYYDCKRAWFCWKTSR